MNSKLTILVLLLMSVTVSNAQQSTQKYSRIHIPNPTPAVMRTLDEIGVDMDCGGGFVRIGANQVFQLECSERHLQELDKAGISYDVQIADVMAMYRERARGGANESGNQRWLDADCQVTEYSEPPHFDGPQTTSYPYQQILEILDEMATLYPDLITTRAPLSSTILTHQNRPVFWVKISDHAAEDGVDDAEPEVLYTSLIHAREAGSAISTIYFMWYLLDNYNQDVNVKEFVDSRELYFVPVLNPDGYVYANQVNPFWRKNMRDNDLNGIIDSMDGVDLNRNFPNHWGEAGSGDNFTDEDYHGLYSFSEPETQMLRDFVQAHDFNTAFHSHVQTHDGSELYFPWEHESTPPEILPNAPEFYRFSDLMCWDRRYHFGESNTLVYEVSGGVGNWSYDDEGIFPWVGEIENGFYHSPSEHVQISADQSEMLFRMGQSAGPHVVSHFFDRRTVDQGSNFQRVIVENVGRTTTPITFEAIPISAGITIEVINDQVTFTQPLQAVIVTLKLIVDPGVPSGSALKFAIEMHGTNLCFERREHEVVVDAMDIFNNGTGSGMMSAWTSNEWDVVNDDGYWITDSPGSLQLGTFNPCTLNNPVNLSQVSWAKVSFQTRWSVRTWTDYVQLEVRAGNGPWTPLCGDYSKLGVESFGTVQPPHEPIYDGRQLFPVRETIDISQFAGNPTVRFRFVALAGTFNSEINFEDGFYFSDFSVYGGGLCADGVQNNGETGIDCGGVCVACPTCTDGYLNQGEEQVDCGGPSCPPCPSCSDGIQNNGETGIDCGGPCAPCPSCVDGIQNQGETGIDCGGPCYPCPTCFDGIYNGNEVGVDCGGDCPPCPEHCFDGIQNGNETCIDCGGSCHPCHPCSDCMLSIGEEDIDCGGRCIACPTCEDGFMNGDETGVDCGGPDCDPCPPTCTDGIQNGLETGIDCGGPVCNPCPPSCTDGIQNGTETGVDCGGLTCAACPTCYDGIQNGNEEGVDCGGNCPITCPYANCNHDGIQNGDEQGIDCGGISCPPCRRLIEGIGWSDTEISIMPNPASDQLRLKVFCPDISRAVNTLMWEVIDITGQELMFGETQMNHETTIDLSMLSSNLYFLRITDSDGQVFMRRFVRQARS